MGDAIATAQKKFYEKYPDPTHWTSNAVDELVSKAVEMVKLTSHSEFNKNNFIADPRHTPMFLIRGGEVSL